MKRLAFNGGEISPAMALRSDMDVYTRSCSTLINWEVSPTGGISRRRGMRPLTQAMQGTSRLFGFEYSSDRSYLIELGTDTLIVRDTAGMPLATFDASENSDWGYDDLSKITTLQLNAVLLICSPDCHIMQLRLENDYSWTFAPFSFKNPPWHQVTSREHELKITPRDDGYFEATFAENEVPEETDPDPSDILRVSYYTPRQEAFATSEQLRGGTWKTYPDTLTGITAADTFKVDDKIAMATEPSFELFVCIKDFAGSSDFTNNCTSPANYPDNFITADNSAGYDNVQEITGMTSASTFKRGDKVKLRSGYWKLYTCIRPFSASDHVNGKNTPADYPSHFVSGVAVGDPLTCRGTWKFHCSGTWFGSYEIRRSYTTSSLTALWSTLGESLSLIGSATNNLITGDESSEECHLRLFLTSVRYSGTDIASGWPADSCGNRLVVSAYKHNMHLTVTPDGVLQDTSPIKLPLTSSLTTDDWSWCAFNARYGYPSLACLHESRLVLASTALQPQTLWFSRTDDLNNFATGTTDDAAMHLTMTTQTQAPICWLISRGSSLQLGTEDGEWVIQSPSGGAVTPDSIRITNQGRIGSAHIPATSAADRLLYCERGSGRLYQFSFDYSQDAFVSQDLTIFADHILSQGGGITGGTLLRKPFCVAAYTLADGTMALMSYNTHHNVHAWHRWKTEGHIHSAVALPNGNDTDRLYLLVDRGSIRYLEVIDAESPYIDGDMFDYTSTMETTAFTIPDQPEQQQHQAEVRAYIASPTQARAVTARTASTNYSPIAHTGQLSQGWVRITTLSGYADRPLVGIRITGDTPCTILSVQS